MGKRLLLTRTARHEIDYHAGHFTHQDHFEWMTLDGGSKSVDKTHRMAIVGFPEVRYFLDELGFTGIATFNGFEDREPGPLSGKKMSVATRRGHG